MKCGGTRNISYFGGLQLVGYLAQLLKAINWTVSRGQDQNQLDILMWR